MRGVVLLGLLTPRRSPLPPAAQALALHGSPENTSSLMRRGLVFQYRAADCYQLADNLWADGGLVRAPGPQAP